jgi:hypothetical protein
MHYTRKLLTLFIFIVLLVVLQNILPHHPYNVFLYDEYIFRPYQSFRNLIFGFIPISVGDILYMTGGVCLVVLLIRWIYFIVKFKTHKHYLGASFLNTLITFCIIYLFFLIGWGANYYKPSLTQYWHLNERQPVTNDTLVIAAFDKYLVDKLNAYAPYYHDIPFRRVNKLAQTYYRLYTDSKTKLHGLQAKASIFGYLMQNLGIQGYYNPFTGEAQVNRFLPSFMLPFVICHEMAHQSGIAAEDDANLLAYALGTTVNDTSFNYSCYFNIWIYAHNKLFRQNAALAKALEHQLNKLTQSHIDTLEAIRRRYYGKLSTYSGELYDSYLRLHNQKDGIRSYNNVAISAWQWEQERKNKNDENTLISIP